MRKVLIVAALVLFASFQASGETFITGWYDWFPENPVTDVAATGGKDILAYNNDGIYDSTLQAYLNSANANGLKVILDVRTLSHNGLAQTNTLANLSNSYGSHPALRGWYTADEPYIGGIPTANLEAAYDALKLYCDKPVYIAFNTSDILYDHPNTLQDAHDVGLFLDYRINETHAELDPTVMEQWKGWMDDGASQAAALGKVFMTVLPTFGENPKYPSWNWRILTKGEIRFQSNYSILAVDAKGIYFWGHAVAQETVANASLPYPYDGPQWLEDIGNPLTQELNRYSAAIGAGAIGSGVSDGNSDVNSKAYLDPDTGDYYLLTVNESSGPENVVFTLNLPDEIEYAMPLYEDDADLVSVISGQLSTGFSDFAVHNYALVPGARA